MARAVGQEEPERQSEEQLERVKRKREPKWLELLQEVLWQPCREPQTERGAKSNSCG